MPTASSLDSRRSSTPTQHGASTSRENQRSKIRSSRKAGKTAFDGACGSKERKEALAVEPPLTKGRPRQLFSSPGAPTTPHVSKGDLNGEEQPLTPPRPIFRNTSWPHLRRKRLCNARSIPHTAKHHINFPKDAEPHEEQALTIEGSGEASFFKAIGKRASDGPCGSTESENTIISEPPFSQGRIYPLVTSLGWPIPPLAHRSDSSGPKHSQSQQQTIFCTTTWSRIRRKVFYNHLSRDSIDSNVNEVVRDTLCLDSHPESTGYSLDIVHSPCDDPGELSQLPPYDWSSQQNAGRHSPQEAEEAEEPAGASVRLQSNYPQGRREKRVGQGSRGLRSEASLGKRKELPVELLVETSNARSGSDYSYSQYVIPQSLPAAAALPATRQLVQSAGNSWRMILPKAPPLLSGAHFVIRPTPKSMPTHVFDSSSTASMAEKQQMLPQNLYFEGQHPDQDDTIPPTTSSSGRELPAEVHWNMAPYEVPGPSKSKKSKSKRRRKT